jgi:hypothetical protein
LHKLKKIPAGFGSKMFKFLFEIAEISNFTESELRDYEASMKALNDYWGGIDYAVKKAVANAEAKVARAEAKAARAEAKAARAEAIGMTKAAKSMLADGLNPARVARITMLSKKQIMAMR